MQHHTYHTTQALIRKNFKDLQEFAKSLNYKVPENLDEDPEAWLLTTIPLKNSEDLTQPGELHEIKPQDQKKFLRKKHKVAIYDCDINEDLWKALISLQPDDTDRYSDLNQYFVINGDKSDIRICRESYRKKMWGTWYEELGEIPPRKATIPELFWLFERKRGKRSWTI